MQTTKSIVASAVLRLTTGTISTMETSSTLPEVAGWTTVRWKGPRSGPAGNEHRVTVVQHGRGLP